MRRQTAPCRRALCGHVGTIHAVNTRRGRKEYGRCLRQGCQCRFYKDPASLLDRILNAVAAVASLLPPTYGRKP
ncbi:hypothetical protein [Catellatospora coxensis]|uniref:Uncharacterized protein n=1 Tax=Catellatospora coxensis TaxID=310354 RepID=A0A8J3L2K2_9ACTN|nr:hypothetical protein [Catellatospora coxensis]GIG10184.1 hypothetical protein Cco03nite_68840 [Catellatospora coxensis]